MNIDFNIPSATSPEDTILTILNKQLDIVKVHPSIITLFNDDTDFLFDIISSNLSLEMFLVHKNNDINAILKCLESDMHKVAKKLRAYQRSTETSTPKNIYLNKLHNAYGVFIIELNVIINKQLYDLAISKMTSNKFKMLIEEPYVKRESENSPNSICLLPSINMPKASTVSSVIPENNNIHHYKKNKSHHSNKKTEKEDINTCCCCFFNFLCKKKG